MPRELGQKIAVISNKNKKSFFTVGIILCWISAILCGFIAFAGFVSEYLAADTPEHPQLFWTFFILFCLFIWFAIILSKSKHNFIEIYEHGLIIGKKDQITPVFFDEIRSTRWRVVKVKFSKIIYFTIELPNGKTETFVDLKEIAEHIEQRYANQKIPAFVSQLQAGNTIEMCNLTLTASGIQAKDGFLSWYEVDHAELQKHYQQLVIWKKGPQPSVWKNLNYYNEPNLTLLTALINTYANGSTELIHSSMPSNLGFRF